MSEATEDLCTECVETASDMKTGLTELCLELLKVETAWKADLSEENPEARTLDIVTKESFSFSGSLALLGWSAGSGVGLSRMTASLVLITDRLSNLAFSALLCPRIFQSQLVAIRMRNVQSDD